MIRWNRVNELRGEVGAEDFAEVVEMFIEEVDEVMDRLRAEPDPSTYEAELHFLKGSALNLGFQDLANLCSKDEKVSGGPHRNDIDLMAVIRTYEQSLVEFHNGQQQPDAA
jgi:HPt (histidine-containing phosphotransfer) domain-containing protein